MSKLSLSDHETVENREEHIPGQLRRAHLMDNGSKKLLDAVGPAIRHPKSAKGL